MRVWSLGGAGPGQGQRGLRLRPRLVFLPHPPSKGSPQASPLMDPPFPAGRGLSLLLCRRGFAAPARPWAECRGLPVCCPRRFCRPIPHPSRTRRRRALCWTLPVPARAGTRGGFNRSRVGRLRGWQDARPVHADAGLAIPTTHPAPSGLTVVRPAAYRRGRPSWRAWAKCPSQAATFPIIETPVWITTSTSISSA